MGTALLRRKHDYGRGLHRRHSDHFSVAPCPSTMMTASMSDRDAMCTENQSEGLIHGAKLERTMQKLPDWMLAILPGFQDGGNANW